MTTRSIRAGSPLRAAPRRAVPLLAAAAALLLALGGCTTTSSNPNPGNVVREAPPGPNEEASASQRARARLDLASAYFGRGQVQTALEQLKLSLAADPNLGPAWNLRGLIYANLGEAPLAEESFRRALQIDPRDGDAMHNFGFWLCQQRRYPEANAQFAQAVAEPRYRGVPRTLLAQGICQAFAGNLADADGTLTRAFELDPGNPVIATNLSEVLYRKGEYERARYYARRVNSQADFANAQTLWLAARIENRLGNRQGAAEFGAQLRNRFPDSREAAAYARGGFDE